MLVVRTPKGRADALGNLVSAQQPLGFHHFALAMNPLGLYGVQPRASGGQIAAYDPHPLFLAFFDLCVVFLDPGADFFAYVPGSVIPDQKPHLLAPLVELLGTPRKKLRGYPTHRTALHEPYPRLVKPRQVEPVARDGLLVRIVFGDRSFDEAHRLALLGPAVHGGQCHPAPPALVLVAYGPSIGVIGGQVNQPVAHPFFLSYSGSGEVIQRLARLQLTPMRAKVARMVSPETRFSVNPSSKLTCAAKSKVHKLVGLPKFLGLWWSTSFSRLLVSSESKAA